tara:strand:- start:438 stop:593 length:156 start_codon:yes stop_codon:yes gene_type:complete
MKIYKQDINGRSNRRTKFDATDDTKLGKILMFSKCFTVIKLYSLYFTKKND